MFFFSPFHIFSSFPYRHRTFVKIFLAIVVLGLSMANIIWILYDMSPPLWDMAGHAQRSVFVAQLLRHGHLRDVILLHGTYPPFSYTITALWFLIGGWNVDIPQLSLLTWFVLFAWALWSLGNRLISRPLIVGIVIILCLISPQIAHFARIYDLDFQLTAMVTAAMMCLYASDHFRHRRWSLLFAVTAASAVLTKWTAGIFLIGPTLFIVWESRNILHHKRYVQKNIFLCLILATIIIFPWFSTNFITVLKVAYATRHNQFSVPYEHLWSFKNAWYYIQSTERSIGWPIAIASAFGIIAALKQQKHEDRFLLLWLMIPYSILTFILYSKESRYMMPAYPALFLLLGRILSFLRRPFFIAIPLLFLGLFFWTETSWGVQFFPTNVYQKLRLTSLYGYVTVLSHHYDEYGFTMPTQFHSTISEIPQTLANDIPQYFPHAATIRIAVVPNSIFLTAQQIQYLTRIQGLDTPQQQPIIDYTLSSQVRNDSWRRTLRNADYVITKSGNQGPHIWGPQLRYIRAEEEKYWTAKYSQQNKKMQKNIFHEFELFATWTADVHEKSPSFVRLYRRRFEK